jgi:type II secretory pathway pseudopilin PulG
VARSTHSIRRRRRGERGVLLLALMMGMTVLVILLTASTQSWTAILKREREQELLFRGDQYIRALKQYQKEHGGQFPTKLDQLLEEGPQGHRYIRQLFPDPFGPEGEWNLLYLGPDGRSAWNPHAAPAVGAAPGLGGVQEVSTAGERAAGEAGGFSALPGGSAPAGTRRRSRFESGNVNAPIVGVVSKGQGETFGEFYGRGRLDEWEFHVFLRDVPKVPAAEPGRDINPNKLIGPGLPSGSNPADEPQGGPAMGRGRRGNR